jgi:hypothetical protein
VGTTLFKRYHVLVCSIYGKSCLKTFLGVKWKNGTDLHIDTPTHGRIDEKRASRTLPPGAWCKLVSSSSTTSCFSFSSTQTINLSSIPFLWKNLLHFKCYDYFCLVTMQEYSFANSFERLHNLYNSRIHARSWIDHP